MIRLIEALNYRCLRYIKQDLKDFHLLVGPNASGKTTFLDVVAFLGDLVSGGLDKAIGERTSNFQDLLFAHKGTGFQLAVELEIPEEKRERLPKEKKFQLVRYEIAIEMLNENQEIQIVDEKVILLSIGSDYEGIRYLFPNPIKPPETAMTSRSAVGGQRKVVTKIRGGNDNYHSEIHEKGGKGWAPSIRLGPKKCALANLPEDEKKFPVTTWLKETLREGIEKIILNSLVLKRTSSPGQGHHFKPDGSNLPWVIQRFRNDSPDRFGDWIQHVRTALPDLTDIETIELPDTRHRYLKLIYNKEFGVPSWMASDGTLRLLALTLPAYLTDFKGIYLIEEPENGIHPQALETVFQSLSSVYSAQILMATHSPVFLSHAKPEDVICFNKDESGATDTVLGSQHPRLKDWHGEVSFDVLYASGVLS
jgi:predicted ATPase